jgi:SAM-dependent methyltransferase
MTPNFDLVARPYRWMEYLTFGPCLHRCRTHFLARSAESRHALVLGDGDGRFLAQLLVANPQLHAETVDLSPKMLRLLAHRAHAAHPTSAARLRTHAADARNFIPARQYDLVVTHFFLDCLTQPELEALIARIVPHLEPNARWVVSDFQIPPGPLRLPARFLVRALYFAFRLLTGLRTKQLPDYAAALTTAGFTLADSHVSLRGLLLTQLWEYTPAMQLPPQRPGTPHVPDPVPDPEPAGPSLPEPDPGVFHPDPARPPAAEQAAPPTHSVAGLQ